MFRFPGPQREPGGRPARARKSTAAARAARSAKRKASVVLELLRGADLESTSRKYGVTAATLTEWRDAFLAAGAEALKARQEAQLDEQGRRMKLVIAEMAMENELLRERIRRMEDEKPFLRWRSRK
jgi:Transposase.